MSDTIYLYPRYHVIDLGAGDDDLWTIDHIACTDDNCQRKHHLLLTKHDIADICAHVLDEAASRDVDAEHNGAIYRVIRVRDFDYDYTSIAAEATSGNWK